jgi:hypothetical protein
MGAGDEWPGIREKIVGAEILVVATPTWMARPSSVAQRVLERMDAMIGETDDADRLRQGRGRRRHRQRGRRPSVVSEVSGALVDIGFTVPAQAWTYWNRGPGPGKSYLEDDAGHDWSRTTGETAAQNLVTVATALAATPFQVPVSE